MRWDMLSYLLEWLKELIYIEYLWTVVHNLWELTLAFFFVFHLVLMKSVANLDKRLQSACIRADIFKWYDKCVNN